MHEASDLRFPVPDVLTLVALELELVRSVEYHFVHLNLVAVSIEFELAH